MDSAASRPWACAIRSSSPSRLHASRACASAAPLSLRPLSAALCAGPSSALMLSSTCPFVCTAVRTELRHTMSSSAACRQPLELRGTISKTVSRLRWRSPAAARRALPDSLTRLRESLKTISMSCTRLFKCMPLSLATCSAILASPQTLARASSKSVGLLRSSSTSRAHSGLTRRTETSTTPGAARGVSPSKGENLKRRSTSRSATGTPSTVSSCSAAGIPSAFSISSLTVPMVVESSSVPCKRTCPVAASTRTQQPAATQPSAAVAAAVAWPSIGVATTADRA
mmetsp:Transcript_16230/g.43711  ORF Transcript_16230/g.43711 Transcript_16230/m.43711 type:complete len:284 (-) Transcript_16230:49-900(-)